jgi:hypothetical protein
MKSGRPIYLIIYPLYVVSCQLSRSRDLFLAAAQSTAVGGYLTVGVLACLVTPSPINLYLAVVPICSEISHESDPYKLGCHMH